MKLCVVSFKECWQDGDGRWLSYGGFPSQMTAIASLFNQTTLVVVRGKPRSGGLPLPPTAVVVPLRRPPGKDALRKVAFVAALPYYASVVGRWVRRADAVHSPLPGDISLLGFAMGVLMRKPLLARYGGSWKATATTTTMNRVTRAAMRRLAGGRSVMLASGEGIEPPAPGVHWLFSTALSTGELERIRPDLDRGLRQPAKLVAIGRLSTEKGFDILLHAMAAMKQRGEVPLPRLTIAGGGPERQELETLVERLSLAESVTMVGQVDRDRLGAILLDSDLAVQPSLTEGYSKAWLDALSYGVPVLASDVGAAGSVLGSDGDRGWLVPPGDAAALAARLSAVLAGDDDWPARRRRARQFVEQRTLEAWAAAIREHCERQWGRKLRDREG